MVMFLLFGAAGIGAVTPYLTTFIKRITRLLGRDIAAHVGAAAGLHGAGQPPLRPAGQPLRPEAAAAVQPRLDHGRRRERALGDDVYAQVAVVLGLAGLGIGAQNASAYPAADPARAAQRDRLLCRLADGGGLDLAGPGAVALTGTLINLNNHNGQGGYRVIFAVCAVCLALGFAVLSLLREREAAGEVTMPA